MSKNLLLLLLVPVLGTLSAHSQVCPLNGTASTKMVCLIPQVYGPYGFGYGAPGQTPSQSILYTGDGHAAHFSSDFLSTFAPINEEVGIQVSELPLASPSSSVSFTYSSTLKTFEPSTDESLGPILGDRASTSGRHRIFVGFSYQDFSFSSIDGQDLHNIPTVLQHQPFPPPFTNPFITACPNQTALTGTKYAGDPCFVRDYIQTANNINLRVHQYTIYATYGITQRLDVSVAIPIVNVDMNVTSNAMIVPRSAAPANLSPPAPGNVWHSFNPANPLVAAQCASVAPGQACLNASFSDGRSASGIGDVVLRGKYTVHQWERAGIAAGVDLRLPTGDSLNFLGSGAIGVKPFAVFSYRARVSPHAEIGYEINGSSNLAGNNIVAQPSGTPVSDTGSLPNRLLYIFGADVRVTKRITGAFDIYGQRLFSAPELVSQPYTDYGNCSGPNNMAAVNCAVYTPGTTHPDIANRTADIGINDASLGLKVRLMQRLVATGNVLIKMDDGGLRSRVVPLGGLSYSF
jgi:hypothetical protein